jgi:ribosomal protein L11 methyltransferase
MHPPLTYELRVTLTGETKTALRSKKRLIDWLLVNGVESFVEGVLEVDINQNQDEPPRDYYGELGGDLSPLSIYRYSRESLDDLSAKMGRDFAGLIESEVHSMDTSEWMEGWKESFKPFATEAFYVRPPWIQTDTPPGLVELIVEPGMAFGTGQHATTRLCLELLGEVETIMKQNSGKNSADLQILDVGTGTGILAIAAKKLGYEHVAGTDIEDDAILAARENGRLNHVTLNLSLGTFPRESHDGRQYDLLLANILAVVLIRLMPELRDITSPGGHLILSGILAEEVEEVQERAKACGLLPNKVALRDGWSAIWLNKPL